MKIAIYAITLNGAKQAKRLASTLPFADVFVAPIGQEEYEQAQTLTLPLSSFLAPKFNQYDHHICFFSAGIVSRVIAPLLQDKRSDPGVLCIDDHGHFVIPMLSGHRGGANNLAHQVAKTLAATPVVTTASDVAGTISVDMLGAPFGWKLDPRCEAAITPVSAAVVNDQKVLIVQQAGEQTWWPHKRSMAANVLCHPDLAANHLEEQPSQLDLLKPNEWDGLVLISDQLEPKGAQQWEDKTVLWRPKSLVLGIGCDRNTPAHVIETGIRLFLDQHNLAHQSLSALASIALKADEVGILEYSQASQIPFVTYEAAHLAEIEGIENPSEYVKKVTGVTSVAEAASLKRSNTNKLVVGKWKYKQDGFNITLACTRIQYDEPLARKKWKNWLDEVVKINAHGNEVVEGFECKPKHVDLNRPMLYHRHHLLVCEGGRCAKQGSRNLAHDLRQILKTMGLDKGDKRIKISRTHCAGACRNRAAMVVYERLNSNETPINNGVWLKAIDEFTLEQWKALFEALHKRTPLQNILSEQFFAPIEGATECLEELKD